MRRLQFSGRTKASLRFGWDNLLYARSIKTGKWTFSYDVGVWLPCNAWEGLADELTLEDAYRNWLKVASDAEIAAAGMQRDGSPVPAPDFQLDMLRQAARQKDGTVLAIGFNRHSPKSHMKSFPMASANALLERGFIEFVKPAAWGSIFRITATGRQYINSYDSKRKSS